MKNNINQIKINELNLDDKNANKHTQKGMALLEKSLSKLGAGRSILIDKNNNIIAGNGVIEVAGQIGLESIKVVETDGNEIIAVKRIDVDINSKKGRELAIADNQTAKVGIDFDKNILSELSQEFNIDLQNDWDINIDIIDDKYTKKIIAPIYEPNNTKPLINDLFDADKYNELVSSINNSNIEDDIKEFLILAATRHIVFDYSKIADYYAYSNKEVQCLFEQSALVIIDFNKAIEYSYINLCQDIIDNYISEINDNT